VSAPPRLLVKTLGVTFITVAALLVVVFVVVTITVRDQVRSTVASNLEAGQRTFGALEARRQREMQTQAATLAENPTLKAALDTYAAEGRGPEGSSLRTQLLDTIDRELAKVAARTDADALVLTDANHATMAAAGPFAGWWRRGTRVTLQTGANRSVSEGLVRADGMPFRVVAAPLQLDDGSTIGTFYLATALDQHYAEQLGVVAGTPVAIVSNNTVLAATLPLAAVHDFERVLTSSTAFDSIMTLGGESYASRRLVTVGDVVVYALASIDASALGPLRDAMRNIAFVAVGAVALALVGSFWLARLLTEPINHLSTSIAAMAASHDVSSRLPLTGSSREIDELTQMFNTLMASVQEAEADTEAAYTGAIRALAAALDARDPYTAGHSERVSVLSVAVGRVLALTEEELEVVRLGALLHDIGKIGVPDQVLRKPGGLTDAEFETIRQHPVLGARILRTVPFLAPHIPIVELHHERPDGRGYPHGLGGDDIPLPARIVHVADAYDAMTTARAYRGARPSADALRELWRCAGTEFHADIVGALAQALPGVTSSVSDAIPQSA
jgi:putative nucleotidyltransferase with HDIG domain